MDTNNNKPYKLTNWQVALAIALITLAGIACWLGGWIVSQQIKNMDI